MVKNTTGGTGTKSLGRKHQVVAKKHNLRISEDPLEIYGCVTKMFGNGMCEITTNKNDKLLGHIRSKMRGRHKRHNMVTLMSIVLVGLREFETSAKNCDILEIYTDLEINQLREMPNVKIDALINMRHNQYGNSGDNNDLNLDFEHVDIEDYTTNTNRPATAAAAAGADFIMMETETINFEDI